MSDDSPTNAEQPSLDRPAPPEGSLWNEPAYVLLARTASSSPTPGGGSMSAMAGAYGLALVVMGLEISAAREDAHPDLPAVLADARTHLLNVLRHPDADVRAFEGYIHALHLPRGTAEEKAARTAARADAARYAIRAPLSSARDLNAALDLAVHAAPLAHRHVVSDVGAGAHLIHGAIHATLLNVDINVGSLPEEERASAREERDEVAREADRLHAHVTALVRERLR
ncbi:cyclodeaminase/cyclohydrolase family protein [Deinococcus maricopensis]|uniref:Formiminotransferase-cyclodeaminase n=1 Tax=Deinococcus maricopensis (strain DSM 21211 / LMG 22137 / NRRL B-23946 / LB-34) TaxID=709986 RepID=E8U5E1_DEIML|nr:cyclodeaminase/cyclohydrolase family protein [Deinococcus maricopensis]ADV66280.1 Formiminotransferase-cyclodeaminase [Deinococcus maricopensis DSM 21211]